MVLFENWVVVLGRVWGERERKKMATVFIMKLLTEFNYGKG